MFHCLKLLRTLANDCSSWPCRPHHSPSRSSLSPRPPSQTQADWSRLRPDPESPTSVSNPVFPCLALWPRVPDLDLQTSRPWAWSIIICIRSPIDRSVCLFLSPVALNPVQIDLSPLESTNFSRCPRTEIQNQNLKLATAPFIALQISSLTPSCGTFLPWSFKASDGLAHHQDLSHYRRRSRDLSHYRCRFQCQEW